MIVRFNKTLVNDFDIKNFSTLVGSVGLYFIFLKDLSIPYPFKDSTLIYIGMSESKSNSIGNRLRDHIAGRSKNAGIVGYHKKWHLIFTYIDYGFLKQVFPDMKIEDIETYFLEDFSNTHGVYPICNNRRGSLEEKQILKDVLKIDWEFFGGRNG
jgi:hypothetical protein